MIAAVEQDELELDFQPKAALATGELTGVEALLRWRHPERGRVLPGEFLPAVEQTHAMRQISAWVIEAALAHATAWARAGHDLPVAVNVAAPNLLDAAFPDVVARLLAGADAAPRMLRLEVTEQGVLADTDRAAAVLGRLRRLGVGISIDDFGTGHSSLARLIALPVDELKVDKGFVLAMERDDRHAAVVEAAVTLGRRLGLTVVAEGVETASAWERLAQLGCDEAQGFVLARPLPADELLPFARRRAARGQSRAAAPN